MSEKFCHIVSYSPLRCEWITKEEARKFLEETLPSQSIGSMEVEYVGSCKPNKHVAVDAFTATVPISLIAYR